MYNDNYFVDFSNDNSLNISIYSLIQFNKKSYFAIEPHQPTTLQKSKNIYLRKFITIEKVI